MAEIQRPNAPALTIWGLLIGVIAVGLFSSGHLPIAAAGLLIVVIGYWLPRLVGSWPRCLVGLLGVVMLIPIDRYDVAGASLPFTLEPYRIVIGVLVVAWLASLLVDGRVHARKTGFEGPLGLLVLATIGSDMVNPSRASSLSSYVVKADWFFLFFIAFVYLGVSLIRSRALVTRLIKVLVGCGCVMGFDAVLQRQTGFDIFDHLHSFLPFLAYTPVATDSRDGYIRAVASSSHPLELTVVMTMLIPLAIYLAISQHQRAWFGAAAILLLGMLATGERTAITGLVAMLVVFLWLRRRQTLSCWPLLIPAIVVIQIADPGALGSLRGELFPSGGLLADQQHVVAHSKLTYGNRLAQLGPTLAEYSHYNPLFGEGYGTRVTGYNEKFTNAPILDDQWLDTLLQTGILGIAAWVWLFARMIRTMGARAKLERDHPEGWLGVALAAATAIFAISMFTYDAFAFIQGTFLIFLMVVIVSTARSLPGLHEPAGSRVAHAT